MSIYWIWLLLTSILVGVAVVAAMVLPRHEVPLAIAGALTATVGALLCLRALFLTYETIEAALVAAAFCIAGILGGYMITAAALPYLAARPEKLHVILDATAGVDGVVILALSEPEHYNPRAVATLHVMLSTHDISSLPTAALPFIFLATRARYHAAGESSPATLLTHSLATRVTDLVAERRPGTLVATAWAHSPYSLLRTIDHLASRGVHRVAVVVLGSPNIGVAAHARALLEEALDRSSASRVTFGPSIWDSQRMAHALVERVTAVAQSAERDHAGIILVSGGTLEDEDMPSKEALRAEHCFNQRVKMLLGEAGFAEEHIFRAWLNWQEPDVTETVRHAAALGCKRIIVVPSTIAMPTIGSALDIETAVVLARVPENVHVVTLAPWGDTEVLAEALVESAFTALGAEIPATGATNDES